MKKGRIVFLRHGSVYKDPSTHPKNWTLSSQGIRESQTIADDVFLEDCELLFSSTEAKSQLTIQLLANKLQKEITSLAYFDEVRRGEKFLSNPEFKAEKFKQLQDLNYHAFNGESANQALERFKAGVSFVSQQNPGKKILIASHGTILNLYFADLLKVNQQLTQRWSNTSFGVYGVVAGSQVVKDIVG